MIVKHDSSGRRLSGLMITVLLLGLASVSRAAMVGSGTFRFEIGSSGTIGCTLMTWTNPPLTVFGTPVDLAGSVGASFCTATGVPPPSPYIDAHCESTPDAGQLVFDQHTDQFGSAPVGFSAFSSVSNVSGTIAAAIGPATFTTDGAVTGFLGSLPATTIPGCSVVGAVTAFTGPMSLSAFQPTVTPTGTDVSVSSSPTYTNPSTGLTETLTIDVTFAGVSSGGNTTLTATSTVPGDLPSGFSLDLGGYRPSFFDVSTDATITPPITICEHYADANNDGVVDGTTIPEGLLTLLHGEGAPLTFVDRTLLAATPSTT